MRRLIPALLLLSACRHAVSLEHAPGAPHLEPSAMTVSVGAPPAGSVALGTVTVQSNNHQKGQDCEAKALYEAKKLGATHVVIRPASSGWGKGPKCVGEAFYLAPK